MQLSKYMLKYSRFSYFSLIGMTIYVKRILKTGYEQNLLIGETGIDTRTICINK